MPAAEADSWRGRKKAKEIRRREKLEAKQDRAMLRRAEKLDDLAGHVSQLDPTRLAPLDGPAE
jgi:hypothetical protein